MIDYFLSSQTVNLIPRVNKRRQSRGIGAVSGAAYLLLLTACDNQKLEVYNIPKEKVSLQAGGLVPALPSNKPKWNKPEGWEEQPLAEMRLGSFRVSGENGNSADVSVIAFPGEAGGLASNLNRWRGQVQLLPLENAELKKEIENVEVNGVPVSLVDFSTPPDTAKASRILGAVLERTDRTWFVKMTGPPELLEKQRPDFLNFVKSFRFDASPGQPVEGTPKQRSTNER